MLSYPFNSGTTLPTALAAPVEAGMMFWEAPRPSLHSLPEGPSTVFCVAVIAWTVLWRRSEQKTAFKFTSDPITGKQLLLGSVQIQMMRITMRPSTMPKLSLMTLARGARQLVVQEALLQGRDGWEGGTWLYIQTKTRRLGSEIGFIQTDGLDLQ